MRWEERKREGKTPTATVAAAAAAAPQQPTI